MAAVKPRDHDPKLCSVAIVVTQEPAEPLAALNLALRAADFAVRIDQLIAQALVISLFVIMIEELMDRPAEHLVAEKYHSQEAFLLDASHEPFDVRSQVR